MYVLARQPRSSLRLPLVGFVAGKKLSRKATERNRAKRRVREAYRQLVRQDEHSAVDGQGLLLEAKFKQWYAVVFVIQAGALKAKFDEIRMSITDCLRQASAKYGSR
jgi:RNase P protein component